MTCQSVLQTDFAKPHQSTKLVYFRGSAPLFFTQTQWWVLQSENASLAQQMTNVVDQNRELRAMILAALPYPPLPVQARHFEEDGNELGDYTMVTSHDIISNLIEQSWRRDQTTTSPDRQEKQREVLRCFLRDLVKDGIPTVDVLYEIYCTHTRDHIASYYPKGSSPELKFFPLAHVSKGDKVHLRTCDWMAGQSRLLQLTGGFTAADWLPRHYHELLDVARSRLVSEAPLQPQSGGKDTAQAQNDNEEIETKSGEGGTESP